MCFDSVALVLGCYLFPIMRRTCKYGGEAEYWVETAETGEKNQEREHKRQRVEVEEDGCVGQQHVVC